MPELQQDREFNYGNVDNNKLAGFIRSSQALRGLAVDEVGRNKFFSMLTEEIALEDSGADELANQELQRISRRNNEAKPLMEDIREENNLTRPVDILREFNAKIKLVMYANDDPELKAFIVIQESARVLPSVILDNVSALRRIKQTLRGAPTVKGMVDKMTQARVDVYSAMSGMSVIMNDPERIESELKLKPEIVEEAERMISNGQSPSEVFTYILRYHAGTNRQESS